MDEGRWQILDDFFQKAIQGEPDLGLLEAVRGKDRVGQIATALRKMVLAFQECKSEMQEFFKVSEKVHRALILDEVLEYLVEHFPSRIPFDRVGIAIIDEKKDRVVSLGHWTRNDSVFIDKGYSAPLRGSSLESILTQGGPRIISDLEAYLKENPGSGSTRLILREGIRSSMTCPLFSGEEPIGFVFFSSFAKNTYKPAHVDYFERLAGQIAVAVQKSLLYGKLMDLNDRKNQFIGMVAHDLRSPLSSNLLYGDLLFNKSESFDKEAQRALGRMRENSRYMLNLIENLLDLNQIEQGKVNLERSMVNFDHFVEDCFENNRILAEAKGVVLRLEKSEKIGEVLVDPMRLGQVFNNLLSNAIKFSQTQTTIVMGALCEDQSIRCWVEDEGPGISEKELKNLIEKGHRPSNKPTMGESSSGLGLAIVRKMVELHGGQLHVESTLGKGSCFLFVIPFGSSAGTALKGFKEQRRNSIPGDWSTLTNLSDKVVLVVDDSTDMHILMKSFLGSSVKGIITARNGFEGFRQLRENEIDITFMDIEMPVVNGYESIKMVRKWEEENQLKRHYVVALTAHRIEDPLQRNKILACGFDGIISKPFRKEELLGAISLGKIVRPLNPDLKWNVSNQVGDSGRGSI